MISTLFAILLSGILPFAGTLANRVWLESAVSGGEYRNVFDASTQLENRLGAQGYARSGAVSVYGLFEYGYDWGDGDDLALVKDGPAGSTENDSSAPELLRVDLSHHGLSPGGQQYTGLPGSPPHFQVCSSFHL